MPRQRIEGLLDFAYPRLDEYEATLRAALLQAMEQWSRRRAGRWATRRRSCAATARPCSTTRWRRCAPDAAEEFDRLRQSLSLVFGTEAFVVLKDIWGLDGGQARDVASGRRTRWCARRWRRRRRRGGRRRPQRV